MRKVTTDQTPGRSDGPGAAARRRRLDRLQSSVINPLDKLAFALRIPPPGDALLETTGRRTGRPRVTPVCDGTEGDTFWIIAQHGRSADYVRNIEANSRVRVKGSLVTHRLADRHGPHPRRRRSRGARADPQSRQSPAPALPASLGSHRDEPADRARRSRSPMTQRSAAEAGTAHCGRGGTPAPQPVANLPERGRCAAHLLPAAWADQGKPAGTTLGTTS